MIVLSNAATAIAIYGVGLIGSALHRAVAGRAAWHTVHHPVRWTDPHQLPQDLRMIAQTLLEHADRGRRIGIVWSAGICRFASSETETGPELEVFQQALESFRVLANRSRLVITLISSLGGLFEAAGRVDVTSRPDPRRPYGWLKLQQEEVLRGLDYPSVTQIYRVSSAYGLIRNGHRLGLVSTLVQNGVHRRVTSIVGRTTALRDFVFADDIGHFLATRVLDDQTEVASTGPPPVLALGRASSIFEIRSIVETVLGRRVLISFQTRAENDSDITVSKNVLAPGWRAQGPAHGLRRVYEDYLSQGAQPRNTNRHA